MIRWVCLVLLQLVTVLCAGDFILSSPESSATLIVPEEAYEKRLQDFSEHIGKVTGRAPKLGKAGQACKGYKVIFKVTPCQDIRKLDVFGFAFPDERTLQVNCTPSSFQPALNRIMEDDGGIRFLMPEYCGTHFPKKTTVTIPRIPRTYKPSFYSRNIYYTVNPEWSHHLSTDTPGMHFNHEIYTVIFPTGHYDSVGYPAGVLPMHKGKRLTALPRRDRPAQFWQPCYSDSRAARLAAENIIRYVDENPQVTTVSLTINDNGGFCECPECMKVNGGKKVSQIGTVTMRNQSEVYFTWVNRVASLVAKKHPRLLMPCLAYAEVRQPPSFKLHPNVPVMITLDSYAITSPQVRKKNLKLIDEWSKRATFIGTWDYAWGYGYALPRMYLKRQVQLLRYLHEHKARTYFLEYEGADSHEGPKFYLYAKLLRDITADPDAILKE